MKKDFNFFLLTMFAAFILVNCEPQPIPIQLKEHPQKLVIFSYVLSDSALVVSVSRTFTKIDKDVLKDTIGKKIDDEIDKILVKNAIVKIEHSGETHLLKTVKETPGIYYTSSLKLISYENISLSVFDPETNLTITSKNIHLPTVKLEASSLEFKDSKAWINIKFNDPKEVKNWYVMTYYVLYKDGKENPFDRIDPQSSVQKKKKRLDFILFKDDEVVDGEYRGRFPLKVISKDDSVFITFSNISEGYYNFLESKKQSNNFLGAILNEPFNYPTNIEGGFGYFNTHSSVMDLVTAEKE